MILPSEQIQSTLINQDEKKLQDAQDAFSDKVFKGKTKKDLKKAAKQFESFMMSFMFKTMYKSMPKSKFIGNGFARDMFMDLYIDEVTKESDASDNGLASMIYKQYEKRYSNLKDSDSNIDEIQSTVNDPTVKMKSHLLSKAYSDKQLADHDTIFNHINELVGKLEDKITSQFGNRMHPILKKEKFHHGLDFALPTGTNLHAPFQGKVVFAGEKGGYGNMIEIDHGNGISTAYAHLSEMNVKQGDVIGKNVLIGKTGSTGRSTGPHLHFEVKKGGQPIDPQHLIPEKKN